MTTPVVLSGVLLVHLFFQILIHWQTGGVSPKRAPLPTGWRRSFDFDSNAHLLALGALLYLPFLFFAGVVQPHRIFSFLALLAAVLTIVFLVLWGAMTLKELERGDRYLAAAADAIEQSAADSLQRVLLLTAYSDAVARHESFRTSWPNRLLARGVPVRSFRLSSEDAVLAEKFPPRPRHIVWGGTRRLRNGVILTLGLLLMLVMTWKGFQRLHFKRLIENIPTSFWLEDTSGRIRIDPRGADVTGRITLSGYFKRRKGYWQESILDAGDEIYIIGPARLADSRDDFLTIKADPDEPLYRISVEPEATVMFRYAFAGFAHLTLALAGGACAFLAAGYICFGAWVQGAWPEPRGLKWLGIAFFVYTIGTFVFSYGYNLYDVNKSIKMTGVWIFLAPVAVALFAYVLFESALDAMAQQITDTGTSKPSSKKPSSKPTPWASTSPTKMPPAPEFARAACRIVEADRGAGDHIEQLKAEFPGYPYDTYSHAIAQALHDTR